MPVAATAAEALNVVNLFMNADWVIKGVIVGLALASDQHVILQPDDSITIPEYLPSVRVTGAVNSPGSVLWRRGASLNYYISAAGGFAALAQKGRVSVRYANGDTRTKKGGLFGGDPEPGPGSEVFVPSKDPSLRTDYVALFGGIAQILASMVAIIVVVVDNQ